MGQLVVDNPHIQAEEHPDLRVLVIRRTASRPESPETLVAAYREALQLSGRSYDGWGLLIDSRLAPGRNDPAFETAMNALRLQASEVFPRVSVLVESAIGLLQSQRLRVESGAIGLITRDEDEAMAFAVRGEPRVE
ncbi:MAG: hypothetical protein AB8I08_11870 [Sandaracinaceae bacterium]